MTDARARAEAWLRENFGVILDQGDDPVRPKLEKSLADLLVETWNSATIQRDCEYFEALKMATLPGHKDTVPIVAEIYTAHITYAQEREAEVLALRAEVERKDEALRRIAEPDQEPLRVACGTGDAVRIINELTRALNLGRDLALAAHAYLAPEPEGGVASAPKPQETAGLAWCPQHGIMGSPMALACTCVPASVGASEEESR